MKFFCFFGIHRLRPLPWFIERDGTMGPKRACRTCGKYTYDVWLRVLSPERGLFSSTNQQYEGQPPPKGYETWKDYYAARRRGIDELRKKLR